MRDESRKRWKKRGIYAAIALVVWLFVTIDDWSRDFVESEASLSSDEIVCAGGRGQCCLSEGLTGRSTAEVVGGLRMAARRIPTMRFTQEMSDGSTTLVQFERSARWIGRTSDITVRIEGARGSARLEAESKSRSSFGDLGQNPRNLSLLMSELADVLDCGGSRQPALRPPMRFSR